MKRSNHTFGRIILTVVTVAGLLATFATTGCDTYGYGYDYSYFDAAPYIQSSYDYQQSVYDYTNSLWDDYIRM